MKLVWWVNGPLEIVQRPINKTTLPPISIGESTAYYSVNDECRYSGRKGNVVGMTFDHNNDAYNKADDMRVERINRIESEISRLQEERKRLINSEITEVFYDSILMGLVDKEKERLVKSLEAASE